MIFLAWRYQDFTKLTGRTSEDFPKFPIMLRKFTKLKNPTTCLESAKDYLVPWAFPFKIREFGMSNLVYMDYSFLELEAKFIYIPRLAELCEPGIRTGPVGVRVGIGIKF